MSKEKFISALETIYGVVPQYSIEKAWIRFNKNREDFFKIYTTNQAQKALFSNQEA